MTLVKFAPVGRTEGRKLNRNRKRKAESRPRTQKHWALSILKTMLWEWNGTGRKGFSQIYFMLFGVWDSPSHGFFSASFIFFFFSFFGLQEEKLKLQNTQIYVKSVWTAIVNTFHELIKRSQIQIKQIRPKIQIQLCNQRWHIFKGTSFGYL